MSMSYQRADTTLNAALRNTATPHIQLHTANPGATGVASLASTTRKSIAFNAPENHPSATSRRVLSSSGATWTGAEIAASQTVTHFSIWSAATGGTVEFISTVAVNKVVGSDGVAIASGAIEVILSVYAKP